MDPRDLRTGRPHRSRAGATAVHLAFLSLAALLPAAAAPGEADPEGEERATREVERQFTTRLEIEPKTTRCRATLAVRHLQHDTVASVEGTIENADCAASGGDYTIAVTIRNEDGDLETLEFDGSWQRNDDRPVTFSSDYPVGENVDVLRVRPRRLSCVCADPAAR